MDRCFSLFGMVRSVAEAFVYGMTPKQQAVDWNLAERKLLLLLTGMRNASGCADARLIAAFWRYSRFLGDFLRRGTSGE